MFATVTVAEFGIHLMASVVLSIGRAALAGALLVAVWAATVLILTYADRACVHLFTTA